MFGALFRTHEGSAPSENAQAYDTAALPHFKRCAELFVSLTPYRKLLMAEAQDHGWPLVRPLWLHYEADYHTLDLQAQFLLGAAVLVAPVLAPQVSRVRTYIPAGRWLHPFPPLNGSVMQSAGEWLELDAPLGSPAVLVAVDSMGRPPDALARFLAVAAQVEQ